MHDQLPPIESGISYPGNKPVVKIWILAALKSVSNNILGLCMADRLNVNPSYGRLEQQGNDNDQDVAEPNRLNVNPSYGRLEQDNDQDVVEPVYEDMYELAQQQRENVVLVTIDSIRNIICCIRKLKILIALLSIIAVIALLIAIVAVCLSHQ